jgi:modulator of FtsH protease HflK
MSDLDKMKHEPPRTTEQVAAGTTPPPPPAHPNPEVVEEAGSRALADALRSSFVIVKILMVGLVVVFFFSGIFTVPSQERAIILRFGRPVGAGAEEQLRGPGLHWAFPSPIDEVVRIPISEVQEVTSRAGWFQTNPEQEAAGGMTGAEQAMSGTLNPAVDGYTITGDGNIIHARATVRYRVSEPLNFILNFMNASNVLQSAVDNALFYVSSTVTVEQATRTAIGDFQLAVERRVRDLVEKHKLGVEIVECRVRITPPLQVKLPFEAVSQADIERRKTNDMAQAEAIGIRSAAQGQAAAIINQGKTEANRLVQQVQAEAKYFKEQLPYYEANPDMFKARLQAEAMGRILNAVREKVFALPEGSELRILLNPLPPRREQPPGQQR